MPTEADVYYHIYEGGEEGKKPPLILIHGAGGSHLYWPSEVRRLTGYRVYALDLPGHGKSGGCGQQSIPAYTQAVLDWMGAIGLHSAVFAGHSMGSAVVLSLSLVAADHVLGLALVGAGAKLSVASDLIESTASSTTFHNAVEMVVSRSFSPSAPPTLLEQAARRMAETRPTVLHGDFLACDAFDESARLDQIQQPALVIVGAEDHMTPPRSAQFLASAIPNARLEVIPDAGHMVQIEQPLTVAHLLSDFLATIPF